MGGIVISSKLVRRNTVVIVSLNFHEIALNPLAPTQSQTLGINLPTTSTSARPRNSRLHRLASQPSSPVRVSLYLIQLSLSASISSSLPATDQNTQPATRNPQSATHQTQAKPHHTTPHIQPCPTNQSGTRARALTARALAHGTFSILLPLFPHPPLTSTPYLLSSIPNA